MTLRSNPRLFRLLLAGALLLGSAPAQAADERVTLFLDGARIEVTASARKGVASVALPPGMIPGSLRVSPQGRAVIDQVTVVSPPVAKSAERERQGLAERRDALEDRLAALGVKEEVFKAAAKSQSGRAPKRTKTNPEPLATIRQGTDYAVAQLEAVYRSRRLAELELAKVKRRLAALSGDPATVGRVAKIAVRGGDRVLVSYLVTNRKWTPTYLLHLNDGGEAQLSVRAEKGAVAVVPTLLAAPASSGLPVDQHGTVLRQRCTIGRETVSPGAQPVVSVELTCTGSSSLPAGQATCFHRGGYLGDVSFLPMTPGIPLAVKCGVFNGSGSPVAEHTKSE